MSSSMWFVVGAVWMFLTCWWYRHRWALKCYMKMLAKLPWNHNRKTMWKRIPPWYLLGGKSRMQEYERACRALEKHLDVIGKEFDE